ncbi:D-3-phosphoglycerate dehydrogenase [hydrothermal vent metagenome]|uniref:D-3-phosphoglycerate dehydrogenase n=1 Tax=hydrothermal vent metagenome TaxID=652676 RepID=A0A3B0W1E9_9ZZZZ
MKVLISDSLSEAAVEILNNTEGIECVFDPKITPEDLLATINEYHGIALRSRTKVTAEVIEKGENLKVIGRAGSGVDNIDVAAATQKGVIVMNTPGGNTVTTGEHAIAMMFALARKIPQATASMKDGRWDKKKFQGTELTGKTLGILGVGNIGSVVASRAQGLKMNVISYDPYISEDAAEKLGITLVGLDELYGQSDFLSIHVPLTNDTRNIINKDAFSKMKKGIYLIHCARGGIVSEADLAGAIKDGIVAGAALDVFEQEPTPADNPLLSMDEVIVTPHLGASTQEAQDNVAIAIAEQIADLLTTGSVRNALNVPCVPAEQLATLSPYITLGEKLGSFQGQLLTGGIEEIQVEYAGEVTGYDIASITIACIKGILTPLLDEGVNYVNAPSVAQERGIKVTEVKSSRSIDFASSITIKIKTKEGENLIEGALFGKSEPRIVKINKFFLDAVPEGNLLVIHNNDKPGVIGQIGTLLGENSVNIARLHLGRQAESAEALSVWNIDTPIEKEIMAKITGLAYIISAKVVEL